MYTGCHCPVTAGQKGGGFGTWTSVIPRGRKPIFPHPLQCLRLIAKILPRRLFRQEHFSPPPPPRPLRFHCFVLIGYCVSGQKRFVFLCWTVCSLCVSCCCFPLQLMSGRNFSLSKRRCCPLPPMLLSPVSGTSDGDQVTKKIPIARARANNSRNRDSGTYGKHQFKRNIS